MSYHVKFRNNETKCFFNDIGYCKFRKSFIRKHFIEKCDTIDCDKRCSKRHPRRCKHEEKCKFFKKKVCAFDHDNLADKKDANKNVDVDERIRKEVEKELKEFKTTIENAFLEKIDSIEKSCEEQSIKCKNLNEENKKIAKELEIKINEYDAKVKELETIEKCMEEQKLKIESLKHKKQGTSQNMILGFESDMQEYSSILKWIGKDLNEFKCEECPFASYSREKLAFHKLSNHQR